MPEEVAFVVFVALLTGTIMVVTIVKMVIGYLKSKHQASQTPSSLTTSELYELIHDAVAEATAPLAARVEALEHDAQIDALPPARHDLLEETDKYLPEETNAPQRQSVR